MYLPTQSKPAARGARFRPLRGTNPSLCGVLPLQGDGDYEVGEDEEQGESADSGESDE